MGCGVEPLGPKPSPTAPKEGPKNPIEPFESPSEPRIGENVGLRRPGPCYLVKTAYTANSSKKVGRLRIVESKEVPCENYE